MCALGPDRRDVGPCLCMWEPWVLHRRLKPEHAPPFAPCCLACSAPTSSVGTAAASLAGDAHSRSLAVGKQELKRVLLSPDGASPWVRPPGISRSRQYWLEQQPSEQADGFETCSLDPGKLNVGPWHPLFSKVHVQERSGWLELTDGSRTVKQSLGGGWGADVSCSVSNQNFQCLL